MSDATLVTSMACRCGAREEIKGDNPERLPCWSCKSTDSMRRYEPQFRPPPSAGRVLTDAERERINPAP